MEDEVVTTSIDQMVEYLYEHGETESYMLANMLNVSETIVGAWADALEQAQLVRIIYKLDKMFLSPTKTLEEQKSAEEGNGSEYTVQTEKPNGVKSRIHEFRLFVANLEENIESRNTKIMEKLRSMAAPSTERNINAKVGSTPA